MALKEKKHIEENKHPFSIIVTQTKEKQVMFFCVKDRMCYIDLSRWY